MRLIMYVGLCICIGFLYFRSGHEWKNVFSITALLFFVVAFLTFSACKSQRPSSSSFRVADIFSLTLQCPSPHSLPSWRK